MKLQHYNCSLRCTVADLEEVLRWIDGPQKPLLKFTKIRFV